MNQVSSQELGFGLGHRLASLGNEAENSSATWSQASRTATAVGLGEVWYGAPRCQLRSVTPLKLRS